MCRSGYALTFGFQAPGCSGGAANFVEARINGVSVWRADSTSALCGVTTDSANQWVDVSQYAGQTVTLSFNSATSNGVSNFFIDDVQLVATAPSVAAPAMSTIGLGALALLLGLAGLVAVRRFA